MQESSSKKTIKRLYRSRTDRMVAGVAGGLAEYFHIDPSIVRLIWVLSVLVWGSGILAYVIFWVIVPEVPENTSTK